MNNFAYTAKANDGALTRGVLTAADRASALQALRRQGLTPVTVSEAGAGRGPAALPPPRVLALAGAAALLLLAGGVWLALSRRSPSAAAPVSAQPVASAPRSPGSPGSVVPADGRLGEPSLPAAAEPPPAPPAPADTGTLPAMPAASRKAPGQSERKVMRVDAILDMATNKPSGYSSGTERVINMIVNTRPGSLPPPLLKLPRGENIAEILDSDILVYDDDSDKTLADKENVAYAKQLLKEYMENGGEPEEFLQHYHSTLTDAFNERQASQKYTMDLIRAGDKEGADKYLSDKNKELEAKGIMPIRIPSFMR